MYKFIFTLLIEPAEFLLIFLNLSKCPLSENNEDLNDLSWLKLKIMFKI